jgi:3-phenylpropionate/trans-cinnamate dioxygenase ferredoxin reductase subunit
VGLEYVGPAEDWDEIVWRGDRDAGEFCAFYLKHNKVAAALSVDRSEDLGHARRLLADGVDVSGAKEALGNADSDLGELGSS